LIVEGIVSVVVGGRTPGKVVLSSREGTMTTAATVSNITKALPLMNFLARIIRLASNATVIVTARMTTFHIFPRANQKIVTKAAPATPINTALRKANSRLSTVVSTTISASRQAIESGSRISCVE